MNHNSVDTIARLISWNSRKVELNNELKDKKKEYYEVLTNAIQETVAWIESCEDENEKLKMQNHLDELRQRLTQFNEGKVS